MKPSQDRGWPVAGHQWAVQQLQHALAHDELPHALLITGPQSIGKTTLARTLVAALFCEAARGKPCRQCLPCRKLASGNHPDLMVIEPEGKSSRLKIDQIREVERFLALTPNESAQKVALINDFETATIGAANALLKTLEEPPRYAHLILLATDADLLLPTIVSRVQQINLRPMAGQDVAQALITQWNVEPTEAERLARISGGRIGWAIRAATHPEYYERMQKALETLTSILRQDIPTRFETAQALAKEDTALPETLEYWLTFWRDVLLLQTGNAGVVVHTEMGSTLDAIAESVEMETTMQVLSALSHAQKALLSNANTQLMMENLLLDMPELH